MHAREAPVYTVTWIMVFALAGIIAITGIRPLQLVNISVVFSTVVMPFTYYPILKTASDPGIMGKHVNSKANTTLGIIFFLIIVIAAAAMIPLTIATNSGKP
jgi:Mn2+/Fe2+ NRAMP family transporter